MYIGNAYHGQSGGFQQVTAESYQKMSQQDQFKYLHQYIEMYKSSDPSLLQKFSRVQLQQPAKQV